MKILETKVMRGPNYWSNYHKQLIVLKLDLEELEDRPTNMIDGFAERLEALIPSLYNHHCSEDHAGGFFERVAEGTWMGHVVEHVALELQCLAGMHCGFGRTRSAGERGIYRVIYSYELEEAGKYAGEAAVRIVEKLISAGAYDISADIAALTSLRSKLGLGPSTQALVSEAKKRGIPCTRLDNDSLVLLGYGIHQKKIRASITSDTSNMAVETAGDKDETKNILSRAFIPVPHGELASTRHELRQVVKKLGYPLVVKPLNGNHGRGITININSEHEALSAYAIAKARSNKVIVERYLDGFDFRFLVINYKLEAVARRTPAHVTGNGVSTIRQLIDETNSDPQRGDSHEKVMTRIRVDHLTEAILASRGYHLDSILPPGEVLFLKHTANLSTGGTSEDVTDQVHPQNVQLAERVARLMNLDVCGIDIIARDISEPITRDNGGVLEVNASPGLRMHLRPSRGLARNVAEPVIDMLFPPGNAFRIPIVAVTGTNGKTTTTRLLAHIAKTAGHNVGYTTTEGIYIGDQMVVKGDCTGPKSARVVLTDPTVDFAVLECARGGILRSGLGFDRCDIGIVTNVSEDHLGLQGINTLREMARVKSVVARSAANDGYSILNADDNLVYDMRKEVSSKVALFSMNADNPRILRHCRNGGLAAVIDKGYLVVNKGEWKIRVCRITQVPLTFSGRAECMVKNTLPAVLAAVIRKFRIEDIRLALQTFIPSPESTPGRFNIFRFRNFDIMIDYAHNRAGYTELKAFMEHVRARPKIGVITAVGDRRDEDIRMVGFLAAQIFDEIIIRHDKDLRGRTADEITALLCEGMHNVDLNYPAKVISDEKEALRYLMRTVKPGTFITTCTDKVHEIISFLSQAKALEDEMPSGEVLATFSHETQG